MTRYLTHLRHVDLAVPDYDKQLDFYSGIYRVGDQHGCTRADPGSAAGRTASAEEPSVTGLVDLTGRVVVVTGAARGIGRAVADTTAATGAQVVTTDVDGDVDHILDVTDENAWADLATRLRQRHEHLHGLVNNAGITWRARLPDLSGSDLHRVHDVNLRGLARAACVDLGRHGIRINTVHPGYIETDMTASAGPAFHQAQLRETPLNHAGAAHDVAAAVAFLLSDAAAYITGADLPVDGGFTAHGGAMTISDALLPAD